MHDITPAPGSVQAPRTSRILAIDLGKFTSVACDYDVTNHSHTFTTVKTRPAVLHDLIVEREPDRVVIEIGSAAGWVRDLCEGLGVELEVANPNHEAWRWKNIKRKTDRDDAFKLARLSAAGQLPMVAVPCAQTRQWRALILYRAKLVGRRTKIKNSIRGLLDRQGLSMPGRAAAWTKQGLESLAAQAKTLMDCEPQELWRGQLALELQAYEQVDALIDQASAKLDALAANDERVQRLRTIPGVGPRLSELIVAVIDDPHRFKSRKQVGAYAGLVPRQIASGTMDRQAGITKAGHRYLRSLLVEVSWLMLRHNPAFARVYEKALRGSKTRKKIAAVATARQLLITCWAMLRDETDWREPAVT